MRLGMLRLPRVSEMADGKYRVAYLVTHPIQYQVPLLRLISAQPDIDLTVFFQSDISLGAYADRGFGQALRWDVPLVGGYKHEFLPGFGRHGAITAQMPISWGIAGKLRRTRFDVLWVHGYARWVNWMAMAAAKLNGLKVFVRDDATLFSKARSFHRRQAKRAFFKALCGIADAFLATGSDNRDYYLAHGVAPQRIFTMPYCVDNDFFAERASQAAGSRAKLRRDLQLEDGCPVILYASKFEPRKRPNDLLKAYERVVSGSDRAARAYLLFAGDGELRPALEAEVKAKGLGGVRFLGFRNQTELPPLYDLCDVFVLPSTNEPWGLVVNEVMATGRPVIVSDRVGCVRDLVKSGVNGIVFPAGDIAALAAALVGVIGDPERSGAMGLASRTIMETWSFAEDMAVLRLALCAVLG